MKPDAEHLQPINLNGNSRLIGKSWQLAVGDWLMSANRHAKIHIVMIITFMLFSLFLSGCSRRNLEAERQQALNQVYAKLRSCLPPGEQTDDKLKIAIVDVKVNPMETAVRIVAYTLDEEIDFDLPVYSMSRGKWLINEKGRAYLLDERCREYKLQDRRPVANHPIPRNGRIHLNPGQAFEAILSFPRMSDTQIGVLVYGQRIMPFWFLIQPRENTENQSMEHR